MLRRGLLVASAAALVGGALLALLVDRGFIQVALLGAVALGGVLLEARRYRPSTASGDWQLTEEKFVDPTTGHLMQVRFDPRTGARDYLDLGPETGQN